MTIETLTESPAEFSFWLPEDGYSLVIGPEEPDLVVPSVPLPIKIQDFNAATTPGLKAIGDGLYEYLCQYPDCDHGAEYATILKQAYPFLYSDIAAQLIVLDVKGADVEGTRRKLALLKILLYTEPDNFGLLFKTGVACYDLALCYSVISDVDSYINQARVFFERARKLNATDSANLNYLGQVCYLQGRYHQAKIYWQSVVQALDDQTTASRLRYFLNKIDVGDIPVAPLVDSLRAVADALAYYEAGHYGEALRLMELLVRDGSLMNELPNPEFYYLLGICREKCHNTAEARDAFDRALLLDPEHQLAKDALLRIDRH